MLQYRGFAIVPGGRQYSFAVSRIDASDRVFTMFVAEAAFRPGLLRYQDGPAICYRKLTSALADERDDSRVCGQQQLTESDVVEYRATGRAKARVWTEEQRLEAKQRFKASRGARL
jgi:hypothetical protein